MYATVKIKMILKIAPKHKYPIPDEWKDKIFLDMTTTYG